MREVHREERDPNCGCLEREVETAFGYLDIHLKPDGNAEVAMDNGEFEAFVIFPNCHSLDEAERLANDWLGNLPDEDEVALQLAPTQPKRLAGGQPGARGASPSSEWKKCST